MRYFPFTAMVLVPLALFAQAKDTGKLQQELLAIESRIALANNQCDYAYFRQIEADEFIFTDSQGAVTTRAEDLAGEKDCRKSDYTHEFDEARLLPFEGTVVLSARHTISGQREGKAFRSQSRFTDVFVWRQGRWQLVAGHVSRIPKKD